MLHHPICQKHDNLGITFDDEKNIVGNTHYAYYVFQDDKSISKPHEKMSGHEIIGTEVRIMHFALTDKLGNSLIAGDKFDLSIPLCGLVESQFNMSYSEYKSKLEKQLLSIYQQIKEYLAFNLSLD